MASKQKPNQEEGEVSSLKKIISMMQRFVMLVSASMNRIFLSPETFGIENLNELTKLIEEKKLGVIFISNHINANDPFVETGFFPQSVKEKILPMTFLASHEKFSGTVKNFLMRLLVCIAVGDGNSGTVREIIRRIKNKETIYMFPEGKVSPSGEPAEDQGVVEKFSKLADIIIQPIHISGLRYFWDLKNMFLFRRRIHVSFGTPFVLKKGSKIDAMKIVYDSASKK